MKQLEENEVEENEVALENEDEENEVSSENRSCFRKRSGN